jgi:hypothetical protein
LSSTVIFDNLLEILLGIVFSFNLGAVKIIWNRLKRQRDEIEKNSETLNMLVNRVFGIEEDPTDEGHLVETEQRFRDIDSKLDEIVEGQKKMEKQRKKEHEKVTNSINSIIDQLSEEEKLDFEKKKLE